MANGGREVIVGIDVGRDRLEVHIRPLVNIDLDTQGSRSITTRLSRRC